MPRHPLAVGIAYALMGYLPEWQPFPSPPPSLAVYA